MITCRLHVHKETWPFYMYFIAMKEKCVRHRDVPCRCPFQKGLFAQLQGVRLAHSPQLLVLQSLPVSTFQLRSHLWGDPEPMTEPDNGSQEHVFLAAASSQ